MDNNLFKNIKLKYATRLRLTTQRQTLLSIEGSQVRNMALTNRSANNQPNTVQEKNVQKAGRRKNKSSKKDESKSVKEPRRGKKNEKLSQIANPFSPKYKYARVKQSSSVSQTQDVQQIKVVATKKKENKKAKSKKKSTQSKKKIPKKAKAKSELPSLSSELDFADVPKLKIEHKIKPAKAPRTYKGAKGKKAEEDEEAFQLANPFQLTSYYDEPTYEISKFSIEMKNTIPEDDGPNGTKKEGKKHVQPKICTIIKKVSPKVIPMKSQVDSKVESLMNYLEKSQRRLKWEIETSKPKKNVTFNLPN